MLRRIVSCATFVAISSSIGSVQALSQGVAVDSGLVFMGAFEVYFAHDFSGSGSNDRPGFLYNHTRLNEFALNLGFVKIRYGSGDVRANFGLMSGTYAKSNLATEPLIYQTLFEANAGILLSPEHDFWFDAGIFPSHIGFESAVAKDNWTLTRSLLAENSPYYEAGARLSHTSADHVWSIALLALNGWQQIQRPSDRTDLCWGTQLTFQPGNGLIINSSTFIGNVHPDSSARRRYFHNFYAIVPLSPSLGLIAGFDAGISERGPGTSGYDSWWSPVVIVRSALTETISGAVRVEYYQDRTGVIIASGTPHGFATLGGSLNIDYATTSHSLCRIEARILRNRDPIFPSSGGLKNTELGITASWSVYF